MAVDTKYLANKIGTNWHLTFPLVNFALNWLAVLFEIAYSSNTLNYKKCAKFIVAIKARGGFRGLAEEVGFEPTTRILLSLEVYQRPPHAQNSGGKL